MIFIICSRFSKFIWWFRMIVFPFLLLYIPSHSIFCSFHSILQVLDFYIVWACLSLTSISSAINFHHSWFIFAGISMIERFFASFHMVSLCYFYILKNLFPFVCWSTPFFIFVFALVISYQRRRAFIICFLLWIRILFGFGFVCVYCYSCF